MRIAITGASGFVGGHLAERLVQEGHDLVLIGRRASGDVRIRAIGLDDVNALTDALAGCDAIAHCAGINREIGRQTYARVHVEGTRHVVEAARRAGVKKLAMVSFLRARPGCGSGYHESKWAAEEIIRSSGLDFTILKCGVIYGRGDHMLDHLSHALHTFPIFALVGMKDHAVRPVAVEDVTRVLVASLVGGRMSRETLEVLGPEEMPLGEAVRRVARVVERRPLMMRLPVAFHYAMAWMLERMMAVPMVSLAQVRILSEGIVEPSPPVSALPDDLLPRVHFTDDQIRRGLPEPGPFGLRDCRCGLAILPRRGNVLTIAA
jgi:uncharacterized protein YbjT (DUF2867 family)